MRKAPLTSSHGLPAADLALRIVASVPAPAETALLQRIADLERRNRELEMLSKYLVLNVEQLGAMVYVDALTGIGNRRYFHAMIDAAIRRSVRMDRPLALLLCDVDCFKHYNDTSGHAHGDAVLARIASLIRTFCRREDDCAARYGGEEFALLLPGVGEKEAVLVADRLRRDVAALPIVRPGSTAPARVTISVGVASVRSRSVYARRLLIDAADDALYRAKRAGRNRVKLERPSLREEGARVEDVVGDAGIEPAASPV